MDEKEAEARPVMGTIFLVIIGFIVIRYAKQTRLSVVYYMVSLTCSISCFLTCLISFFSVTCAALSYDQCSCFLCKTEN